MVHRPTNRKGVSGKGPSSSGSSSCLPSGSAARSQLNLPSHWPHTHPGAGCRASISQPPVPAPKIHSPFSGQSSPAPILARAEPVAGDQQLIIPPHTTSLLPFLLRESSQHPLPVLCPPPTLLPLTSLLSPRPTPVALLFPPMTLHHCKTPSTSLTHSCRHLYSHPEVLPICPTGLSSPPRAHLKVEERGTCRVQVQECFPFPLFLAHLARCCSAVIYRCTPPPCCRRASWEKRGENSLASGMSGW